MHIVGAYFFSAGNPDFTYLCFKIRSNMRIPIASLLVAVLLTLSACGNSRQEAAQQKAWDEMMVIHDEVMPRMSEITALGKSIQAALADTTLQSGLRADAEKVLDDLAAADNAMWDWMYALQQLPDLRQKIKHEDIMAYIQEETKKITEVKNQMLSSIAAGQAIKQQLPAAMPPADMPPK